MTDRLAYFDWMSFEAGCFEADSMKHGYDLRRAKFDNRLIVYLNNETNARWMGWFSRAILQRKRENGDD